MATSEQFNQAVDAWHRLDDLCDQAACNPAFKTSEIAVFKQMSESMKACLDRIEVDYWKVDPETLESFANNLSSLGDNLLKLFEMVHTR